MEEWGEGVTRKPRPRGGKCGRCGGWEGVESGAFDKHMCKYICTEYVSWGGGETRTADVEVRMPKRDGSNPNPTSNPNPNLNPDPDPDHDPDPDPEPDLHVEMLAETRRIVVADGLGVPDRFHHLGKIICCA